MKKEIVNIDKGLSNTPLSAALKAGGFVFISGTPSLRTVARYQATVIRTPMSPRVALGQGQTRRAAVAGAAAGGLGS